MKCAYCRITYSHQLFFHQGLYPICLSCGEKHCINRANLIDRVKNNCLTYGDFELSSGKKSHYYLDLRKLTLCADICLIADFLYNEMQPMEHDSFGGVETGANAIIGALLYKFASVGEKDEFGFVVKKELKGYGNDTKIIGNFECDDRVIMIDDVTTTGESLMRACEIVEGEGGQVVQIITIIDRLEGAGELFEKARIPYYSLITIKDLSL